MNALALFATSAVAWSGSAWACLNVSEFNLDGKKVEHGGEEIAHSSRGILTSPDDPKYWREREEWMRPTMSRTPTVRDRADFGGILAHLREFEKAKAVLEEAEKLEPGNYAVASNLGTVYELLGDNEKARTWIAEGIKRQLASHGGTEWLHLRILDAKLALAADPQWLQTHRVLDVDYGAAARPVAPAAAEEKPGDRLRALSYQMGERLKFVKAPEPIVGELLFALGNELCLADAVKTALGVYELALTYQPVNADLLRTRTEFARQVLKRAGVKPKPVVKGKTKK